MAETTSTPSNGVSTTTVILGLIALSLAGVAGYMVWKRMKGNATPADEVPSLLKEDHKTPDAKEGSNVPAYTVETATAVAASKSTPERITIANSAASGDGVSPIRTNHDKAWNYQKKKGVWYTAKKDGTVLWTSLANNAKATATLNKAYPND